MQHVLLIRHGQTDANAAGIVQGHLPTPLNQLGIKQAELLAKRLFVYHPPITRLITSPLIRAVQTAEPISRLLRLHAVPVDAWTERHFGSGQGKPFDLYRIMTHGQLGHVDPEDAEPKDTFDIRVRHALADLDPSYVTAVITHGGVIGSILRQIISGQIPTSNPPQQRKPVPNCSILHLMREDLTFPWKISCLHDASHLAGLESELDAG